MGKATWFLLAGCLAFGWGEGRAQMLTEKPVATGGDPVGIWEADSTSLQVYAEPEVLSAVKDLAFGGWVSGRLTLEETGDFQADYVVVARVSLSLLGTPLSIDIADTMYASGTYVAADSTLVLVQNTTPVLRDTMLFSVEGDSLRLIQVVPLGEFSAFLPQGAGPPLAVLKMGRIGRPDVPVGPITTDFDGSGRVDFPDFVAFASHFGTREGEEGYDSRFDLNDSGEVGFNDFLIFAQQFGHES